MIQFRNPTLSVRVEVVYPSFLTLICFLAFAYSIIYCPFFSAIYVLRRLVLKVEQVVEACYVSYLSRACDDIQSTLPTLCSAPASLGAMIKLYTLV